MARRIVLHYHLYKNAGTSLDHAFRTALPDRWLNVERDPSDEPQWLADTIRRTPRVTVYSSHTAEGPVPELAGVEVLPVIFVRHPIDRARSVYTYARKVAETLRAKGKPLSESAAFAEKHTMAEYISWRLDRDYTFRNFHRERLRRFAPGQGLDAARRALDTLPVVGLVEEYAASVDSLNASLRTFLPSIQLEAMSMNQTQSEQSLEQRLTTMEEEVGATVWRRLLAANGDDLTLWETVRERMEQDRPRSRGEADNK